MARLFDASSLVNLIIERGGGSLNALKGNHILDLTPYEVGNALLKLKLRGKIMDEKIVEFLGVVRDLEKRVEPIPVFSLDFTGIMDLAVKESTTFYDASYVATAKARGLGLVTDDRGMWRIAHTHVEVKSSAELFKKKSGD